MNVTKILYFDWWSGASEWYRLLPLNYLSGTDFTITRSTEQQITSHLLDIYDIIILCRPSSETQLYIIKLAKDLNKKVIIDYDDAILSVPLTNPAYGEYEPNKPHAIQCLMLADEIWVATEGIKKTFQFYNKNIHIIPNAWNDTVFLIKNKPPLTFNKLAMYRGGHSHLSDIYEPGTSEYLISLINDNQLWKWYFLGQRFEWLEYRVKHGNYYRNDGATPIQFYKMMSEFNPCLFFYPLSTSPFNEAKTNCSILESCYAGAAYFGNTKLPEFQKPGVMDFFELSDLLKCKDKTIERTLAVNHKKTWGFISENLLLSKVNEKRRDRLLKMCNG